MWTARAKESLSCANSRCWQDLAAPVVHGALDMHSLLAGVDVQESWVLRGGHRRLRLRVIHDEDRGHQLGPFERAAATRRARCQAHATQKHEGNPERKPRKVACAGAVWPILRDKSDTGLLNSTVVSDLKRCWLNRFLVQVLETRRSAQSRGAGSNSEVDRPCKEEPRWRVVRQTRHNLQMKWMARRKLCIFGSPCSDKTRLLNMNIYCLHLATNPSGPGLLQALQIFSAVALDASGLPEVDHGSRERSDREAHRQGSRAEDFITC